MQSINSFPEALSLLKNGMLLSTGRYDQYYYRNERIFIRRSGSSFSLTIEEFTDLYKDSIFYLYEDNGTYIDDQKDEDYYRYYHK